MGNKLPGMSDDTDEAGKLPFKLLKEITNNFDPARKLGGGASGEVYKGEFKDGKVIAVKKLRFMPCNDDKQFQNEFEHLKRLKHKNIVKLVGICDETEEVCVSFEGKMVHAVEIHRALCLEFMPNGGLGKFLSDKYLELNWHTRFKIIHGTCHGLKYLHELRTMHFDLKPDNILLDEKMMPKIADFGLSRLLGEENTVMTKTPLGTIGYLPPEFINKQSISRKYDIFSLGVIIKRIMTGTGYWNISDMDDCECIEHVHSNWRKRLQEIPAYESLEIDCKQVRSCIEIAVNCTQEDPRKRPTMNEIASRLSNVEIKDESKFHDGEIYLPDTERPPGGRNVMLSGLESEDNRLENKSPILTIELPLEFLREITNNFSTGRVVSKPTFATVFKGILHSGEEISVKRFGGSYVAASDNVFRNEVSNLMKVEHGNVLGLIGFCYEKKRKVVKHNGRYILTDEVESYLCHEYAQGGSLNKYIDGLPRARRRRRREAYCGGGSKSSLKLEAFNPDPDESCKLDWNARFRIIIGICEGLHFLHTESNIPIIDTPLAPEDILLDSNMVPKLSDVGVSNLYDKLSANSSEYGLRAIGYMAPEYFKQGEISVQSDIYRLGLLIMQIVTGLGNAPSPTNHCGSDLIDKVHEWGYGYMKQKYPSLDTTCIGQLKLCIQTAFRCIKLNGMQRPSIREIVKTLKSAYSGSMLDEDITSSCTTSRSHLMSSLRHELSSYRSPSIQRRDPRKKQKTVGEPGVSPTLLLSVLPERLCFHLEPKRLNSCLLYLTNNTNDRIAFRLAAKTPRIYQTKLPLRNIVPPRCTYTLTVTMREQQTQLPSNNEDFLILQCSVARDEGLENVSPASVVIFFEKAKEKRIVHEVQEIMLPVVFDPTDVTTSGQLIELEKIIASQNCRAVLSVDVHPTSQNYRQVLSIDVHPNEPWILTSNCGGNVCIWNYQKKETVKSFEVIIDEPVYSAKFIERKNWLVAGDGYGYIHVYSYDTMEEVSKFEAHDTHIMSLAVNPIFSFVLSASDDHLIKLWDWNKGWECMRKFEGHYNRVTQVTFHPKDSVTFASASLDRRVKIWNIFTDKSNIMFDEQPGGLFCLQYFEDKQLHYVRQFLIVGSSSGLAKVWDPEKHSCVGTLEGHTDRLNALCWLPKHDVLVTGSLDGTIQIWRPTNTTYRLENTIGLNLGAVNALGYIKESRRLVVGCEQGIAMVEIN